MCVHTIQVLWHFLELSLILGLAQSSWTKLSVLGQKPLCWTVDGILLGDFPPVNTHRMLVCDV